MIKQNLIDFPLSESRITDIGKQNVFLDICYFNFRYINYRIITPTAPELMHGIRD